MKVIGPFKQIITLRHLPLKGALLDAQLEIIEDGAILVNDGKIQKVADYNQLVKTYRNTTCDWKEIEGDQVLLPAFVDAHTHICFGGSRAQDFAARNSGQSYLDIAKAGGGIWSTVQATRIQSQEALMQLSLYRLDCLKHQGVATVEVKSGYGLSIDEELKMLRAIQEANKNHPVEVIATCLAAHTLPKDFRGNQSAYLEHLLQNIIEPIKRENLCQRFDIFIEQSAFEAKDATFYLQALKNQGFDLTVHADQFSCGGSKVAVDMGALSADHLEVSGDKEINYLAKSQTVATVLPGASLGLGLPFAPARKLLDAGACLAIASDWNPGSGPHGYLLAQAAILSSYQKLSAPEVFAGIGFRAAKALGLADRGILDSGFKADLLAFPCADYREILYHQGQMLPSQLWKNGHPLL